jgi:hypothetical protein
VADLGVDVHHGAVQVGAHDGSGEAGSVGDGLPPLVGVQPGPQG